MEQFVERTLTRAEEVGNRRALALCYHALGAVRYLRGNWIKSASDLQCSVQLAREVGGVFGEVLGLQRLGLVETGLGQYDAAHHRLEGALSMARASRSPMVRGHGIGRVLATLARNRLELGETAQAADYLAQGFDMQRKVGDCPSCDVLLYPVAVPLYIGLGDVNQAEAACRKAEETAAVFRSQAWTATAGYLRGLLATARGDWHVAVGSLERATEQFESLDQPYDVARGLEALADAGARAGAALTPVYVYGLRERALSIYVRLGAQADRQRLKDFQLA